MAVSQSHLLSAIPTTEPSSHSMYLQLQGVPLQLAGFPHASHLLLLHASTSGFQAASIVAMRGSEVTSVAPRTALRRASMGAFSCAHQ